jgi:hypothetical protein
MMNTTALGKSRLGGFSIFATSTADLNPTHFCSDTRRARKNGLNMQRLVLTANFITLGFQNRRLTFRRRALRCVHVKCADAMRCYCITDTFKTQLSS